MPQIFSPGAEPAEVGPLTVQQVVNLYLHHLAKRVQAGDYALHTYDDARRELLRFAGRYGGQAIAACRKYDLTSWLDDHPEWESNHTRKRIVATISGCFSWACDVELIDKNPYPKPKSLKLPTSPRRPASQAEYVLLMRHGSRALRRFLFFLRRSGMRTCEVRELVWSQVDFELGVIRIEKHKTRRQRADAQARIIGLDPATLRFLRNLHRQQHPSRIERVFLNTRGQPWKTRQVLCRHFRRTADRLGVARDLSAYCLRHSYTTGAVELGIPDRSIADQQGWSSTRMVGWYGQQTRAHTHHLRQVAEDALKRERKPRKPDNGQLPFPEQPMLPGFE